MQTKLTLRLDNALIEQAKTFAKQHNKSLSVVVADFFYSLTDRKDKPSNAPMTQSLTGILSEDELSTDDYKKHLEKKYL